MSEQEQEVTSEPAPICLNCSELLALDYCPNCGQSSSTSRYTFASLVGEIYSQVRKLDITTSFRTINDLTIRPGEFVREYLAGKRVGFLNPVKFFFYSFVVQIFLGAVAFRLTNDHQYDSWINLDYRMEFIGLASTMFWGLFWALFFRRSELNLVENITAAIFFVGQVNFLGVVVNLVALPIHFYSVNTPKYVPFVEIFIEVVYGFFFVRQLFKEPFYLLVPKQIVLTFLFLIVCIIVSFGGILIEMLTTGKSGP